MCRLEAGARLPDGFETYGGVVSVTWTPYETSVICTADKAPDGAVVNTPWRCVAGAIYNIQLAGYPTVGFISNPVDPNG